MKTGFDSSMWAAVVGIVAVVVVALRQIRGAAVALREARLHGSQDRRHQVSAARPR